MPMEDDTAIYGDGRKRPIRKRPTAAIPSNETENPRPRPQRNKHAERIYIREAADLLNRRMSTLRKWEQLGVLPRNLRPHRGPRNWRYWTPEQIEGIKEWIRKTDRRSGKALKHWNPTEKELDKAIDAMRRPHSPKRPRMEELELT